MQKFKFRLETVLHARQTAEDFAEKAFSTAYGKWVLEKEKLTQLDMEFQKTVAERPGSRAGERFDPADIFARERYLETIMAAQEQQRRYVETARMLAEEQRMQLLAAKQAREAVSTLKDRDLAAHTYKMQQIEQNNLDEKAAQQHIQKMNQDSSLF